MKFSLICNFMGKLRLLLLNSSAIYGGGEYYVQQLAKHLKNRGHTVIIGCRENKTLYNKCIAEDIMAEHIDFGENGSKNLIRNLKRIKQLALDKSVQIIHTNTGNDRTAGAVAARLAKAAHVTSCHSLLSISRNLTHRYRNKNLTNAFIADGETIKKLLVEKDNIDAGKICVINNGINPAEMVRDENSRRKIRQQFRISESDIVIGNTARFVYFKGQKYLLTAFASLCEKIKNVKLMLVGDGEWQKDLQSYAMILNISQNVIFAGFRDDLREYYSAFDIYVQPSLDGGGELFPFTVLYAMAQKLPVIATNIGDLPVMVEDGKSGLIVEEKSPYRIAESLETLVNNSELRLKFGRAGYEKLLCEYTIDKMIDKTEKLYYNVLKTE